MFFGIPVVRFDGKPVCRRTGVRSQESRIRTHKNSNQTMRTMKAYIHPETVEVPLMADAVMKITGPDSLPPHVSSMGEDDGSMMFDAPAGNKRRQL